MLPLYYLTGHAACCIQGPPPTRVSSPPVVSLYPNRTLVFLAKLSPGPNNSRLNHHLTNGVSTLAVIISRTSSRRLGVSLTNIMCWTDREQYTATLGQQKSARADRRAASEHPPP